MEQICLRSPPSRIFNLIIILLIFLVASSFTQMRFFKSNQSQALVANVYCYYDGSSSGFCWPTTNGGTTISIFVTPASGSCFGSFSESKKFFCTSSQMTTLNGSVSPITNCNGRTPLFAYNIATGTNNGQTVTGICTQM